jgi:hypothetical protein
MALDLAGIRRTPQFAARTSLSPVVQCTVYPDGTSWTDCSPVLRERKLPLRSRAEAIRWLEGRASMALAMLSASASEAPAMMAST